MDELLIANTTEQAKHYSYLTRKGRCRRLCKGVYTSNLGTPLEALVQKHWMAIVAHLAPGAILSHRTAIELKPVPLTSAVKNKQGVPEQVIRPTVFLTGKPYRASIPGLDIRVEAGDTENAVEPVLPNLMRSNRARRCLENTIRPRMGRPSKKILNPDAVELELCKEMERYGEQSLKALRAEIKALDGVVGYEGGAEQLDKMIGALLATRPHQGLLASAKAQALAEREPFDQERLDLMERFADTLAGIDFIDRPFTYQRTTWRNLSFFESYFSNYIEGTEFTIEEAEEIVFERHSIADRHADSHDVAAVYELTADFGLMQNTPGSAEELIGQLKQYHAFLMSERPEKHPGEFKTRQNQAGNTVFVLPENVEGTLSRGFEVGAQLESGMKKALFLHYLISVTHPFDDGNGRLSRLLMNGELTRAGLAKIMVPTVYRDNYLNGLRRIEQQGQFNIFMAVMDTLQAYTHDIDWLDYGAVRQRIESDAAHLTADEGLARFYRQLADLPKTSIPLKPPRLEPK